MKQLNYLIAVLACSALLAACGASNEKGKLEEAINQSLAKTAACTAVPVGVVPSKNAPRATTLNMKLLQEEGLIEPSLIQEQGLFGGGKAVPGFVFTDKGRALIHKPTNTGPLAGEPCVRSGRFQIKSIEGVETVTGADGQTVVVVRSYIQFKPEAWLAKSRTAPEKTSFWNFVQENESAQWVYRIKKSDGAYVLQGTGTKI